MVSEIKKVRNLALKMKEKLKYKKITFKKGDDEYEAIWKGFGTKALKFEIYVSYEDLLEHKDDKSLEKELWQRLMGEYTHES